ncbi:hypothetical protein [Hymenobacter cellulosivorans]|uniref:Uncharacterized protein n=1 Tax=Hymenobacter cellulosivorans TaxID=2932249 RepID=A0ABY4F2H0_9BACT|nr:hypothetical protein [Hymenobacter cellulosivorans]UOQ50728.1 hypothetical protein MUN80_13260 [Hymenobacter cellulosivorans]
MKLSIERLIREDDISPLFWGMNETDLLRIWPHMANDIREGRQSKTPLLNLDEVELYFTKDYYQGLSQLIIQVWAIEPAAETQYLDFGWINNRVTLGAVRKLLTSRGWEYEEGPNPGYAAPLLMVEKRAAFLFQNAEDGYLLEKIVIYSPEDALRRYQIAQNMKRL